MSQSNTGHPCLITPAKDFRCIDNDQPFKFCWRSFLRFVGPGFLMSIAYLDPGNLQADIQLGAVAGFNLLWLLFASTLIGGVFQSRAIILSVVTGKNLAEHCRLSFPKPVYIILWAMVELAILGADVQEVLGTAIALNILSNGALKIWHGTLITVIDTSVFLVLHQSGLRLLEAFFGVLIMVMSTMFGYLYFSHLPSQAEVLKGVCLPRIPKGSFPQAVGMIGSTIMAHNLYLHSSLALSRNIDRNRMSDIRDSITYNHIESALALMLSFFINMFVVCNFTTIKKFPQNIAKSQIGVASAARCLEINYGKHFKYIWAIGLLASGQSSTWTTTLTGQFVIQGFFNLRVSAWKRLAFVRFVAVFPAMWVALFAKSPQRIDEISEWLNILQAVILPFAVLPLISFSQSRIRLRNYSDSPRMRLFLYLAISVVLGANIGSFFDIFRTYSSLLGIIGIVIGCLSYGLGLMYFASHLWVGEIYTGTKGDYTRDYYWSFLIHLLI